MGALRFGRGPDAVPAPARLRFPLLLINAFGTTRRALDAWLVRYSGVLHARFDEHPVAQSHSAFADLGNQLNLDSWTATIRSNEQRLAWIVGDGGGAGKSSLALAMARSASTAKPQHPVVPVLVAEDWTDPIDAHVTYLLRAGRREPTPEMLRLLGASGRIVVVFDGLSERTSINAQNDALAMLRDRDWQHAIITSRQPPPDGSAAWEERVGKLIPERLEAFVSAYAVDDVSKLAKGLAAWAGGRDLRPLLARLAIELLVRGEDLPLSELELIAAFIIEARPRGAGAPMQGDFLRAVRKVAFVCSLDERVGAFVDAEAVRLILRAEAETDPFCDEDGEELNIGTLVEKLVESGLLQRSVERAKTRLRFADDSIAELLAKAEAH